MSRCLQGDDGVAVLVLELVNEGWIPRRLLGFDQCDRSFQKSGALV